MRSNERSALRCVTGILLISFFGSASAQQPPRPAPHTAPPPKHATVEHPSPQGDVPQQTTATYADWIVQCVTRTGQQPEKVCDMAQVTQVKGKNVPFSRIAIPRPDKGQPVKLVVQVPVNVSFQTSVKIQTSDSDPGLIAPFARCLPAGCFADFELKEDVLRKLRAASGAGKLSFADAGAHPVAVPLSFNGFSQAFEALAKD
jgi:invasion protein IalB